MFRFYRMQTIPITTEPTYFPPDKVCWNNPTISKCKEVGPTTVIF